MKKILLFLLIIFILYILAIFNLPKVAGFFGDTLGLKNFNEFVLKFKSTYDDTITNIPSKEEFLSGALDIKDNVIDGVNTTKDKIDSIRSTLSGAENTYNDIKDKYNEVKDFVDSNSGIINQVKDTIDTVSEISEDINN